MYSVVKEKFRFLVLHLAIPSDDLLIAHSKD